MECAGGFPSLRFENGLQTTGMVRNGAYVFAPEGFDRGWFHGRIQEVHAVLFNRPDAEPSVWPAEYGPARQRAQQVIAQVAAATSKVAAPPAK